MKSKLDKAIEFATKAHEGQTRWGGEPYITHPEAVANRLKKLGYSEEVQAAGWLHDVVEDTSVEGGDIVREFGKEIANLVWWVTQDSIEHQNYGDYIDDLAHSGNQDAIGVKLADLWHNSQGLEDPKHRQRREKYQTSKFFLFFALEFYPYDN